MQVKTNVRAGLMNVNGDGGGGGGGGGSLGGGRCGYPRPKYS